MLSYLSILLLALIASTVSVDSAESSILDRSFTPMKNIYCSTRPKISSIDFTGDGMVLNFTRNSFVGTSGNITLRINCTSTNPIEWIFDGVTNPSAEVIDTFRERGESHTQPCYTSFIQVNTVRKSSGRYRCQTIDRSLSTELYVYGPVHTGSILLNNGQKINMVSNGSSLVIMPCQVKNPYHPRAKLFKGDDSEEDITGHAGTSRYDPEVGFTLDLSKFSDPYDTYKCKLMNELVTLTVKEQADSEASPSILDEGTDDSPRIFYNSFSDRFICESKSGTRPVLKYAECSNPSNCKFVSKCFTQPYDIEKSPVDMICPPEIVKSGELCAKPVNCSYTNAESMSEGGIVHCTFHDKTQRSMTFFKGIGGNRTVITDWNTASPDELIQIVAPNRTLYVTENVTFNCKAVKFISARGFEWLFEMNDGSNVIPTAIPSYSAVPDSKKSSTFESISLRIDNANIKAVVCRAAIWNSTTEWLTASHPVKIKNGTVPIILSPQNQLNIVAESGSNESILCQAEGDPKPSIQWFKNGIEIKGQQTDVTTNGSLNVSSWLHLGIVNERDEGVYKCLARNVLKSTTHTFRVTIKSRNKYLIIVGLTLIIGLVLIIIGLLIKFWMTPRMSSKDEERIRVGYDPDYELLEANLFIDETKILGEGEYGSVFEGLLKIFDAAGNLKESVRVAVKRAQGLPEHLKTLFSELKTLIYIETSGHDNIIHLYGALTQKLKYYETCVVLEYCSLGNLLDYLRKNKDTYWNQILDDTIDFSIARPPVPRSPGSHYVIMDCPMNTRDLLIWSEQIADAMMYLGDKMVIHGDLAARNILLKEGKIVKIADFGLAVREDEITPDLRKRPWRWMAPEVLEDQTRSSTASDVWSFGVILYEMFSLGEIPYDDRECEDESQVQEFRNDLLNNPDYRLDQPEYATEELYNIMLKCWRTEPSERITFAELKEFFRDIIESNDNLNP